MFPIMNFIEISLPVNFDSVRAETKIFDKINSMVNKMLSILLDEILSVSLLRSTSILSQVRTLVGCHTDLSELTIKPALVNQFETKVDFSSAFSKMLSIPRPSSKKEAIFMELNLQYFTNGLTTSVKTKGAVDKPNGRTVKTKNFTMLSIFHEKPR